MFLQSIQAIVSIIAKVGEVQVAKTFANLLRNRRGDRALSGAPVAFILGLLLTACQGGPSTDGLPPGQTAETMMRVADDTRAGGDPATAVNLYRRAHEMKPSDPEPLARLAATLAQLKAYKEAIETYHSALELAPNDSELHRGLAIALLSLDQTEQAVAELQLALAKKSDDPRILSALGVAHDLMGRHDLAQQDYRAAMSKAPKNVGLRNNYGLSLALSGDYAAAIAALGDIAGDPGAPARYKLNLALVYGLSGDDQKAAAVARTTLDEESVRNNVAYYVMLRNLDERTRSAAIMGRQVRGAPAGEPVQQAADPEAAPRTAVAAAPLADPPAVTPSRPSKLSPAVASASAEPLQPPPPKPVQAAAAVPPAPPSPPVKPEMAMTEAPAPADVAGTAPSSPASSATPAPSDIVASRDPSPSETSPPATSAPVKLTKTTPEAAAAAPPEPAAVTPAPTPEPPQVAEAPASEPATDIAPAKSKSMASAESGFALQLGSFSSEANARKLADQLNRKGYEVGVAHNRDREGRDWYIVRAGGYATADEAEAAARHIREAEQVPAVVVHLRSRSQA
jgi:Flp pilus assembly protein TadD/cell division septation protein DedD